MSKNGVIFFKWLILVALNATMSFYMAMTSDFGQPDEIIAMLVGVVIFIGIYTYSEISIRAKSNKKWLNILNIGIFIRTLLVILIPLGLYIDVIFGVLTISAVELLMKAQGFFPTLIITLLQGGLLSLLVLILGITIEWIYRSFKRLF
jgi:hypothetical protein